VAGVRTRLLATAALLAALTAPLALTGCDPGDGSSSPTPGTSAAAVAPPDPCALITAADLEKALGETFEQDSLGPQKPGRHVCGYRTNETGHTAQIAVYADASGFQALVDAATKADGAPTAVTGVGQVALRTHKQLFARFSNFVLAITLTGVAAGDSTDAALETLGHTASDRI